MEANVGWLLGVVATMAAAGISFFYQGKALEKPAESKVIGKRLRRAGWVWMGMAAFYLVWALYMVVA